jgi:hypothetical protein
MPAAAAIAQLLHLHKYFVQMRHHALAKSSELTY